MFSSLSSRRFSLRTGLVGLLSLSSFFCACLPSAAVTFEAKNGGFELGDFTGWEIIGRTSIETATYGSGPTEGAYQTRLDTFSEQTVGIDELVGFLNIGVDELRMLGDVYEGSAIQTTFTANKGDVLSFDWNFLTNDFRTQSFNDFAFVAFQSVEKLADTFSGFPMSLINLTDYKNQTGFQTFSYTFTDSGTYSLGIGVADVEDGAVDSGLLVDNVSLLSQPGTTPVPEPTSVVGLLAFGVFGVGMQLLRRK
jgi:hypothetical protein